MTSVAIIIGYRDRGTDPLRQANLTRVLAHWAGYAPIHIISDGRTGTAQFNRHAAYNRGAHQTNADILAYVESDMLLDHTQMDQAVELAAQQPRLVVPFTERHELGPTESELVRQYKAQPHSLKAHIIKPKPRRTGAINVISRHAYQLVGGYDEAFQGCWWDDRSMHIAFDTCTNPTVWVDGPSWHLYHLPGYTGSHLTTEDKAATAANKHRWQRYRQARTPEQIRALTSSRHTPASQQ